MLTLKVENTTAQPHVTKHGDSTFNIGSKNGENVQIGNSNTLTTNITIQELAETIAKSDDPEAKSKLKKSLQNSIVGSLIGAGASALISILQIHNKAIKFAPFGRPTQVISSFMAALALRVTHKQGTFMARLSCGF